MKTIHFNCILQMRRFLYILDIENYLEKGRLCILCFHEHVVVRKDFVFTNQIIVMTLLSTIGAKFQTIFWLIFSLSYV